MRRETAIKALPDVYKKTPIDKFILPFYGSLFPICKRVYSSAKAAASAAAMMSSLDISLGWAEMSLKSNSSVSAATSS